MTGSQRVALVTGGGRGIGKAICHALAGDGRIVAVTDLCADSARSTAEEIVATGAKAIAEQMDVTDSAAVPSVIGSVVQRLRPVEILVNCAGWDRLMPFLATDEQFWDTVIEINYKGALRTVHHCLPSMTEAGWGRIVNIGSDAGRVGSSLEAVYAGTKGAVIAFTKTVAREAARHGVTANVVCPGPTDTPLLTEITGDTAPAGTVIEAMTRAVPMKRLGRPEEVAAAVGFLASEDAGFITGQTLSVSGGLTMV